MAWYTTKAYKEGEASKPDDVCPYEPDTADFFRWHGGRRTPFVKLPSLSLEAENALLKKKLEIALAGLNKYGDGNAWCCRFLADDDHNCTTECTQRWHLVHGNGYDLARRAKAEIEEVK